MLSTLATWPRGSSELSESRRHAWRPGGLRHPDKLCTVLWMMACAHVKVGRMERRLCFTSTTHVLTALLGSPSQRACRTYPKGPVTCSN